MAKKKVTKAKEKAPSGQSTGLKIQVYAIWALLAVALLAIGGARKRIAIQEEALGKLGLQLSAVEARPLSVLLAQDRAKVKDLYYKGVDLYVKNHIQEAIGVWEELLKIEPDHADATKNIERAKKKMEALKKL